MKAFDVVGIYMPCRGTKTSESDSIETLDEISEIVCKYEQSCNILLAGDLNAALLKDAPNSRDKKLLSFINVHSFNGVVSLLRQSLLRHSMITRAETHSDKTRACSKFRTLV
jgi:hypothetical protein